MEGREFCLDFLEGNCLMNIKCKFAHVIMKEKEEFLKTKKQKPMVIEENEQTYTMFEPSVGSRKWLTKCRDCEKAHYFYYNIRKGSLESMYCRHCVDKYKDQIKETFEEDFM